jgi:hypothetical protein
MTQSDCTTGIVRTLAYYEIFQHPLTPRELYALSPVKAVSYPDFTNSINDMVSAGILRFDNGFLSRAGSPDGLSSTRHARELIARRRMRIARMVGRCVEKFPFVRGVFVSGDLSKGVATPGSDIDYVIITEPGRLWICRTILIMFKKIFLFDRKKYFCMNYFVASNHLPIDARNYYVATEIAHLKPLANTPLFLRYINANSWIKNEFPNLSVYYLASIPGSPEKSFLRRLLEFPFRGAWVNRVDSWIMQRMEDVWKRRYTEFDDATRSRIFTCSPYESRAFVGNFADRIDTLYRKKLAELDIE